MRADRRVREVQPQQRTASGARVIVLNFVQSVSAQHWSDAHEARCHESRARVGTIPVLIFLPSHAPSSNGVGMWVLKSDQPRAQESFIQAACSKR